MFEQDDAIGQRGQIHLSAFLAATRVRHRPRWSVVAGVAAGVLVRVGAALPHP